MIKWLVTEGVGFMIATAVVAGLTGLGCTYSCGWRRDSADSAMGPSAAERAPQAERQKPRVALVHGGCSNPEIFRRQLKKLVARIGDQLELVDLQGGLLSKEVRFDERGLKNMTLLHKIFGARQVLREHAVTKYDQSQAARYPPHGTFVYDRLEEGLAELEAQLQRCGPVDALLGFSQGANMAAMLAARSVGPRSDASSPAMQELKALVLLENDPPGWAEQAEMRHVFALIVGGSEVSPKSDAVGELFAQGSAHHVRHADGHRPLPKNEADCEKIVRQIVKFLLDHCHDDNH